MSAHRPPFTALAEALPSTVPFVGPEAQERTRGRVFAARLGANENGFGPSPNTVAALAAAASEAWMYGDPEAFALREALGARLGALRENILIGEGIDGLLGLACRLMLSPGDRAVGALGGYPTFAYHVAGVGGALETVPYQGDRGDLAAMLERARQTRARLLYLANPDNPMGGYWEAEAIEGFVAAAPEDCLVLLDEAYLETAPSPAPPLDLERPNLLRLRTFSKAYGLAGLRIGYALGAAETIAGFDKIRNHFGVGRLAQAGALAALEDEAGLQAILERIKASRDRIAEIARRNGLSPLPSAANFVAVDCGRDGAFASAVLTGLAQRDVFVRMPGVAPLNRCIRVSCGPEAELARFAQALEEALHEVRKSFAG